MSSPSPIKLLLTFLSISAILFLSLFGLSNSLKATPKTTPLTHHSHSYSHLHVYQHLRIARSSCDGTLYPELCVSTLVSLLPTLSSKTLIHIISGTVKHTIQDIKASSLNCRNIKHRQRKQLSPLETTALDDCIELFDSSIAELRSAISDLTAKRNSSSIRFNDVQTLFSGVMTNQYTCLDGFAFSKGHVREAIMSRVVNISRHTSNSLAMLQKIPGFNTTSFPTKKPEVFPEYGRVKRGFPTWLSSKDRKMLQTSTVDGIEYDIVVAKDGTGNFTTINEAVDAAPKESTTRFVIYIKAGAYFENVEVPRKKTMLMFLGDGIGKTVIKASRNVVDGWTTFRSATVAVVGNGFIAKGITIENAAGPSKHQAVALRSGSDFSAFYKCSFVGYQDTLYVHSLRQFYRDCDVYGTVDFVFGNAAVVLQNCNLYARKPNDNQKNMFTAQGREDPFQNTGISIMYSKIAAAADLIPNVTDFKTYLGRPWKEYSRTVILRSYIGDLVDPAGWMEWNADFALSTLYYGEYMNRGPGSNTSARVTWPGFRVLDNITEAGQFTVEPFLQGSEWLNSTGVPYSLDLI